jgi:hypothetical protein
MAWPNLLGKEKPPVADPEKKDEKPPEKSPAELIAESLRPLTEKLNAMDAKIDSYKPVPVVKKVEPTDIPSVLDDENAAFNARTGPLYQRQLETEARLALSDVKAEYADLGFGAFWRENESKINAMLANTALAAPDGNGGFKVVRGDPDYIRNVADMFIGRAARSGGVRFNETSKSFFLEDATGSATNGGKKPDTSGLTAKQIKVFERMGVSLEDAKKSVSKLEFVS